MAHQTCQGIVLRRSDYLENDRILTLFTPTRGKVEVRVRGCRKPKSPLLAASETFTLGEYVLYQGKGGEMVTGFTLQDSFYALRQNLATLSRAAVAAGACLQVIQKDEENAKLFILLYRTLARLCYGSADADSVLAAFLLHFAAIEGFKPRLNHCSVCQKRLQEQQGGWLEGEQGGIVCSTCFDGQPARHRLSHQQLTWLRQVLVHGVDKADLVPKAPLSALMDYVQHHIQWRLPQLMEE